MLARAGDGLRITPEDLRDELVDGGDMPDVASGALTPEALRLVVAHSAWVNSTRKASTSWAVLPVLETRSSAYLLQVADDVRGAMALQRRVLEGLTVLHGAECVPAKMRVNIRPAHPSGK
jgi:hypothetical protein